LSFSPLFTAFLCTTKAWQKQHQENGKRMKAMFSFLNHLIHSELAYHFLGAQLLLQNHTVQTRRLTFSSFSTLLPVFTILLTVANVLKNLLDAPIPHKSSLFLSLRTLFLWSHKKNLRNLSLRELFLPLVSHKKHLNSLCFSCVSPLSLLRHIHSAQITETNRTNSIDLKNSNRTVEEGRYLSVAGCKNSN
jgi:hypothetical protein